MSIAVAEVLLGDLEEHLRNLGIGTRAVAHRLMAKHEPRRPPPLSRGVRGS